MRFINKETGEIIDIEPYRFQRLRDAGKRSRPTTQARPMRRSQTYHLRLTWGFWWGQLAEHLGPVVIAFVVLWALTLGGRL